MGLLRRFYYGTGFFFAGVGVGGGLAYASLLDYLSRSENEMKLVLLKLRDEVQEQNRIIREAAEEAKR